MKMFVYEWNMAYVLSVTGQTGNENSWLKFNNQFI